MANKEYENMAAGDGWIVATIVLGILCLALIVAIVYTIVQWYRCDRALQVGMERRKTNET